MKKNRNWGLPLFVMVSASLLISNCVENDINPNLSPGKLTLTSPTNEATDIALNAPLSWQAATDPNGDAVTYNVYLGTDVSPVTIVSSNQAGVTYIPTLTANTTYYWKVIAKDPDGANSESAIWSFTTLNNGPEKVTLTSPSNAATDVTLV